MFVPGASDVVSGALKEYAAIVTRAWSSNMVNLTVFRDMDGPICISSVERGFGPRSWHECEEIS